MGTIVHVPLGTRSYDIRIGSGLRADVATWLPPALAGRRALIISDTVVAPLYAADLKARLESCGCATTVATVPAGEASKSGESLFHLYEHALDHGMDRRSFIVALGGGVVGDLAGYVAASYLRGIPFVQVPTTLLAMVDSAVGGKTGINLPRGKNLIGAFHQPVSVVCDLEVLATLPARERSAGLAEVIKYGVIQDAAFFDALERQVTEIHRLDPAVLGTIVARSCAIKAAIVGQDEREEGGARATLNFGHTAGHAIEAVAGYGRYLHGEAISIGMIYAARVSERVCSFPSSATARLMRLCRAFGLPVERPDLPWTDIRAAMSVDKKSAGGLPRFVLASAIGSVRHGFEVPEEVLSSVWTRGWEGAG